MSVLKVCTVLGAVILTAPFAFAQSDGPSALPEAVGRADIIFLGEFHDNPQHHRRQADWVEILQPAGIVFEMLTSDQAAKATVPMRRDEGALKDALEWEASGWPDFAMYYPIFAAAPNAEVFGAAVPRQELRSIMKADLSEVAAEQGFHGLGLEAALPEDQQNTREALQRDAHCGALPENLLAGMVNMQRVRDASLARSALAALERVGGPVVVITGNGHARLDWGAPFLISQAAPDISVFALGQGEEGIAPAGRFDAFADAQSVARADPCAAFK